MQKINKVPNRNEVPEVLTWDLSLIFPTDQDFESAFKEVQAGLSNFAQYQGTLRHGTSALLAALRKIINIYRKMEKLYVYSSLKNDQDTTDPLYHGMFAKTQALSARLDGKIAWFKPELLKLGEKTIQDYCQQEPQLKEYKHLFDDTLRFNEHILSTPEEKILASLQDVFATPENIFSILDDADLHFPDVVDQKGVRVQLTDSTYSQLIQSTDRSVRKQAFIKLYRVYHQFFRTFAQTLTSQVHIQNFQANIRHYKSAMQAALNENNIPVSVYENLVQMVHQHLDELQRYVSLRQKALNLSNLEMYDLYTPLTGKPEFNYSFEQAKKIALKALAVLGPVYVAKVQEAFDKRYIDVVHNKGKRGGAYSGGSYDTAPYILLNWNNDLDSLYTLVHEMGHSMHI